MLKILLLICSFYPLSVLLAQEAISTENGLGVEDLVKNVFVKGNCRNVSNISAIGNDSLGIGQFGNGSGVINISNGILISTGAIDLATGPNFSSDASYSFDAPGNDPDLDQLATSQLYDITGITFDFVPLDNRVTFRYVFASEEYCEFVGTSFNDVFGFFVSGPGINGPFDNNAINVANIPGSNDDVSINTVNHLSNTSFYVNNITNLDAEACGIDFDALHQESIEYDGFTVRLTATLQVIPCETYHIRLVIGDVGDPNLDSAVFLEANSFDLGEKVIIRAEVPGRNDPIAYEDCADGQFVFTRSNLSNLSNECTVAYAISPESQAQNGIDFEDIPLSITIPAGDSSAILPIRVIGDNETEGPESLKLEFVYDCDCIDPVSSELIIDEARELSLSITDQVACANQAFSIPPEVTSGVSPYDFLWSTGATSASLTTTLTQNEQFSLTITDFCGSVRSDTVEVVLQDSPSATLTGVYDYCTVSETGIPVQLTGSPPWAIFYSINATEQPPVENIQTTPFYIDAPKEGVYSLLSLRDVNCAGSTAGEAVVEQNSFRVAVEVIPPSCSVSKNGSIEVTQLAAIPPFIVQWDVATADNYFLEQLEEGIYTMTITDANGCQYQKSYELVASSIELEDCSAFYIPNAFSPNNDGINDIFSIFFDPDGVVTSILAFEIYDRWGALLFQKLDYLPDNSTLTGWEGNFNGRPLNPGIYVYKFVIQLQDGTTLIRSGELTLLR